MSTRTSYHTLVGHNSCEELIPDEQSLVTYFSITSSNELTPSHSSIEQLSSENVSQKRFRFNPLSRRILNNDDKNNSSNYIILEMEPLKKINILNNVSQL
jgi:hypothetical protein